MSKSDVSGGNVVSPFAEGFRISPNNKAHLGEIPAIGV